MRAFDLLREEEVEVAGPVHVEKGGSDFILSLPHDGTLIPSRVKDKLRVSGLMLTDTDLFSGEVYDVPGGVKIVTELNRFVVNMNRLREEKEDPKRPSYEREDALRNYLLDGRMAWKKTPSAEEREWLLGFFDEYHSMITTAVGDMKEEQGYSLLFDCHTMNSRGLGPNVVDEGEERPDFGVCTLNDTLAGQEVIDAFTQALKERADGFEVAKNKPFTGGFISETHSRPEEGIHAIQVEVNKKLYMDEETFEVRGEGLRTTRKMLEEAMLAARDATEG